MSACKHEGFDCHCAVTRLEDTGQFSVDVTLKCSQCTTPFQFLGLPLGLDLSGAAMSVDGQTARLAIAPVGEVPHPLSGVRGFTVKTPKPSLDS